MVTIPSERDFWCDFRRIRCNSFPIGLKSLKSSCSVFQISNLWFPTFQGKGLRIWEIIFSEKYFKTGFLSNIFKHFADLAPIPCHKLKDLEPAISFPKWFKPLSSHIDLSTDKRLCELARKLKIQILARFLLFDKTVHKTVSVQG